MIPLAKHQLAQALHSHYRAARRVEKAQILDAFVKATGYHRNYAIALLHHGPPQRRPERRGRPARYGAPVVETLRRLWEASGYLCSKRLRPFLAPPSHDRALRRTHTLAPGQDRPRADERRHHRSQSSPPIGGTPSPAA